MTRITLWIMLVLLIATTESNAIIIRHDREDSQFKTLAESYPAAVHVLPGESGALIGSQFVLTAAHVAQGMQRHQSPMVVIDGAQYSVERIFLPPSWNGRGAHDVGVLRLAQVVEGIQPAALYHWNDEAGLQVVFVGWGDSGTGLTGPVLRDDQKRAATNRVDKTDNDWVYFTFNKPDNGATELEGVSGPGDSGGPAFVERDGILYVLGVSSHGFAGKPGRYGTREAYTRISTHVLWIKSVLAGSPEHPGFLPGTATSDDSGERTTVRRRGAGQDLATIPGGSIVLAYLDAYNSDDNEQMSQFIAQHFSIAYQKRKTSNEQLALYERLHNEVFGKLASEGVVQATDSKIILRVSGEKQKDGELHFTLNSEQQIDDMMFAIIEMSP